jgi:hypothetical protein
MLVNLAMLAGNLLAVTWSSDSVEQNQCLPVQMGLLQAQTVAPEVAAASSAAALV